MTSKQLRLAAVYSFVALVLLAPLAGAQSAPARIVSLVPSATEALFAMGAGNKVVGVGSFDTFPPEVERLPRVGALLDPDVERILSLKPDLMVCYASQTELQVQLGRAGIRLYRVRHGTLADVGSTIRELGRAAGTAQEADTLADRVEAGLHAIRSRTRAKARPRVMLVIGRETQSLRTINVSGGHGFLHDLVEVAGGINVFADVRRESLNVSTETALARAPEVILELRYSGTESPASLERERRVWDALPGVPAVRAGRVRVLSGGELVVPGPRVVQTAERFAEALQPAPAAR